MQPSSSSDYEAKRLAVLHRYDFSGAESVRVFDDLIKLANLICGTPIALISLIDYEHQRVKVNLGLESGVDGIARDQAFCSYTIQQTDVLVIPDTLEDERVSHLPLVTDETNIRFYAGAPLITPDGYALGALCIMDHMPRDLRPDQIDALRILSQQVIVQMQFQEQALQLSASVEEQNQLNRKLESTLSVHHGILEAISDALFVIGLDGRIHHVNQSFQRLWNMPDTLISASRDISTVERDLVFQHVLSQVHDPEEFRARALELYGDPESSATDTITLKDGRVFVRYSYPHRLHGAIIGRLWGFRDVTEQKRAEAEQKRLQAEVIRAQAAALAELSTPLIPLTDESVLMPLVGSIDTQRAQRVVETLLMGVSQYQANFALLDITGVPVVDTQVAQVLIEAAQAVRLLGAQVLVTGIRPEVAQTLVSLQVDLSDITTLNSLQESIRYVIKRHRLVR